MSLNLEKLEASSNEPLQLFCFGLENMLRKQLFWNKRIEVLQTAIRARFVQFLKKRGSLSTSFTGYM